MNNFKIYLFITFFISSAPLLADTKAIINLLKKEHETNISDAYRKLKYKLLYSEKSFSILKLALRTSVTNYRFKALTESALHTIGNYMTIGENKDIKYSSITYSAQEARNVIEDYKKCANYSKIDGVINFHACFCECTIDDKEYCNKSIEELKQFAERY